MNYNLYEFEERSLGYLIDPLLYIFEKIYSFENKTFLIIEDNITNQTGEIIKTMNIQCEFYNILIKNFIADHLKHYSYYSTFSLLFFLNLIKKARFLTEKWGNKNQIGMYFQKIEKEILSFAKSMKLCLNQNQIIEMLKQKLNIFADDPNHEVFFEQVFQGKIIQKLKIQITFIYNYQKKQFPTGIHATFRLKYDHNKTNPKLLEDFFMNNNNSSICFENVLLLETGCLNLDDTIIKYYSSYMDFIKDLVKKNIKIVVTNGILSDLLLFTVFGNNIIILGNIKLKNIRYLSLLLNINLKLLGEFQNYQTNSDYINQKINVEVAVLNCPQQRNYLIFINKNSNFNCFHIILPYISEPISRKQKHFIKTLIQKYQILAKFKKGLCGGGVFELRLAQFLRAHKRNKIKEQLLIKEDVRNAIADIFEDIVLNLLNNEGYTFQETQNYIKSTNEISGLQNLENLDEYKGKKYAIKSSFLYLKIFMKSVFNQKN